MYASIHKRADIDTLRESHVHIHTTHYNLHGHSDTYIRNIHTRLLSTIYLIYRIVTGVSKMRNGCIPIIYILIIRDKSILLYYRVTNVLHELSHKLEMKWDEINLYKYIIQCAQRGEKFKRDHTQSELKKHTHTHINNAIGRRRARCIRYMTSFKWLYLCYIVEIQEIWSACLIGALGVVHTPREERTNLKIRETSTRRNVHHRRFAIRANRRGFSRAFNVRLL